MRVAGVDGCRSGWLFVGRRLGEPAVHALVYPTTPELLAQAANFDVIAVDIPIGLPDKGSRQADIEARRALGRPRGSSVFPAPIRPALRAMSRAEASEITRAADGRGVGAQAWGIYPKVREIDAIMAANPRLQEIVREVHPEISFWAWNGGEPMRHSKRSHEGRAERRALIDAHFGPDVVARIRDQYPHSSRVGPDDILDALAALWSAERVARGEGATIPAQPPLDSMGLRVEMVY